MEDHTVCMLDLRIPFPIKIGVKEVSVGVVAVGDGHNGAEASEMASKLLLEIYKRNNGGVMAKYLFQLGQDQSLPWPVVDDFNGTLFSFQKGGGRTRSERQMKNFHGVLTREVG
ncbi:hypothetical protein GOBAR_DD34160 [Gossypium barbadense]|nr:hypothetical protein GOBAR_DD34160 [Gossypium barbadense]